MISIIQKKIKLKQYKKQLFILPALLLLIVGVFFVTRGLNPHTSELAFIEHSPTHIGSVVPASCNSAPPTSHFLNDCTATCPSTGLPYDPYLDAGACPVSTPTAAIVSVPFSTINYGGAVFVSWSSTGSTGCTTGGDWTGSRGTSGGELKTGITSNKTYTLYCSNGGTNSSTVSTSVSVCPLSTPTWNGTSCVAITGTPIVAISAIPLNTNYNGTTSVTWSSINSSGCTAAGAGWSGTKNLSGTSLIGGLTSSQTYNIYCSNSTEDSPTAGVTVNVCPVSAPVWDGTSCVTSSSIPVVSITALPSNINYGASSLLSWVSSQSTGCTATGDWSGVKTISGATSTGSLLSSKTYNIYCSNAGGNSVTQSFTVNVCPIGTPVWDGTSCTPLTGTIAPNSCSIVQGSGSCSMNVDWRVENPIGIINARRTYDANSILGTGPLGDYSFTFPYSTAPYNINLYDVTSNIILDSADFTASCALGGFDTISSTCVNPTGTSYLTGNYYGPGIFNFTCTDSNNYKVRRDGTLISSTVPGGYTSGTAITLPIAIAGNYQVECLQGSYGHLVAPNNFNPPPPPAPIISILASPRTITKNTKTALSWSIQFPIASCVLTAKAVCNNNICTPEQLAAETLLNNKLTSENTDTTDPNGSRSITTAVNTIIPSHINTDWKALGKKTMQISNSMDFSITCGAVKSSARVRVTQSNEQ